MTGTKKSGSPRNSSSTFAKNCMYHSSFPLKNNGKKALRKCTQSLVILHHEVGIFITNLPLPTHNVSHRFRKVRMLDGRLVFAITLSRLAQPTTVKGQMTRKWGYHRMEITKWTNACMECLMDT